MKTFKAGEKVRIAKGNNGHSFAEGTVVTLCEDVTEHTLLFAAVDDGGLKQFLEIEDIEPITSDALRPGTSVKIVKGNFTRFHGDGMEGKVGTLLRQDEDRVFVEIEGDYWWMTRDDIEVIEDKGDEGVTEKLGNDSDFDLDYIEEFDFSELDDYDIDDDENEIYEPSLDVPAFKVGDKVRVITDNPYYGWGGVRKGDVGTVIAIDDKVIRVNFPRQSRWNGRADEFEIVKEAEVRFKVGDIVKGRSGVERYRITNESMTRAEVIDVFEDRMIIRVLEHETHPNFVGGEFSVEMEYFELVEEAKIDTELVVRLIKSLTEEQKTMLRELLS